MSVQKLKIFNGSEEFESLKDVANRIMNNDPEVAMWIVFSQDVLNTTHKNIFKELAADSTAISSEGFAAVSFSEERNYNTPEQRLAKAVEFIQNLSPSALITFEIIK